MDRKKNTVFRNVAITGVVLLMILAFSFFTGGERGFREVDTSVAMAQLDQSNVKEAVVKDREQQVELTLKQSITPGEGAKETDRIVAYYPAQATDAVFDKVAKSGAEKFDTKVTQFNFLTDVLPFAVPFVLIIGLSWLMMSRMQGGRGGLFGVGKSRAVEVTKDMPKTTFADVAGEDEAVEELNEIKDFLQNPARYERLGAKIPRGVLLYGPPGTGKTLLARAVAGEAGVPFYSISGSDFVEMFVGVGASRVRDLFEKAKANSPCIVFVDEIDAVGRQRGAGLGGGHDEREQTLNQLLVEMDGFGDRQTVILIAATNRPDVLDPALLRPGRFDRQVPVVNPDLKGREAILAVHSAGKPLAEGVDMKALARRTIGMSGADLANVLNEGALLAARLGRDVITEDVLEEATDRVVGGPRRKHRVISEHEKKVTAYHESGHALAAWAMEDLEPVHKVTILARGRTGGHALVVPEDDKSLMTRADMLARVVMAMGGRAAEEYVFGSPTSGASSDIESATNIARAMVTEYGMSARLGAVKYGDQGGDPFLGRGGGGGREYSDEVAATIDEEVRRIVEAGHDEAWKVLEANREILDRCASELLEKETLRQDDLERIFADVATRPRIAEFDDFGGRVPSTLEPVKTPGELAKERGEPWPPPITDPFAKPVQIGPPAERVDQQQQRWSGPGRPGPGQGQGQQGPGPQQGRQAPGQNPMPQYGTPPPPGWTAPGWPPAGPQQSGPQQAGPVQPSAPAPQRPPGPMPQQFQPQGSPQPQGPGPRSERPSRPEDAYPVERDGRDDWDGRDGRDDRDGREGSGRHRAPSEAETTRITGLPRPESGSHRREDDR